MVHLMGTWARQRDTVAPLETRVFHYCEPFYHTSAREMRVHCAGKADAEPRTRNVRLG